MNKRYRVEISRSAERQLKVIHRTEQSRIAKAILELENDPHPQGVRKLTGYSSVFRLRVGVYRIIYSVEGTKLIVIILKIGHRKDVYRGL